MHAQNGHLSTSGLKSVVIIVFFHPETRKFRRFAYN